MLRYLAPFLTLLKPYYAIESRLIFILPGILSARFQKNGRKVRSEWNIVFLITVTPHSRNIPQFTTIVYSIIRFI